ncbi:MAG: DnaA/Hda family protein [Pseudomonadota bacterium]
MSGAVEQLRLPFGFAEARRRSDFLVSEANRAAVAMLTRAAWPRPHLALIGPAGSGKSHLARIWAEETGATPLAVRGSEGGPPPEGAVVFEDADRAVGDPAAEQALFHLLNAVGEQGGRLLLTARRAPAQWGSGLPDLASRLSALPVAEIHAPDDILLSSLLVKLFRDRQLSVPPVVVQQIAARIERSYEAATEVVAALDDASLAERRTISHKLAASVLERQSKN